METYQLIGIAAGTLTTLSFLPQVIRTIKTKSSRDLSPVMVCIFIAGMSLWLAYGIMTRALPIILANSATLALTSILLFFVFRYRR